MDIDVIIANLKKAQTPNEARIVDLCERAKDLIMQEPTVLKLEAPITVVGDIHG